MISTQVQTITNYVTAAEDAEQQQDEEQADIAADAAAEGFVTTAQSAVTLIVDSYMIEVTSYWTSIE